MLGLHSPDPGTTATGTIKPDLIVIDMMVNGFDPYIILRELSECDDLKNVPVIVISNRSELGRLNIPLTNIRYHFYKPFEYGFIRDKIREII